MLRDDEKDMWADMRLVESFEDDMHELVPKKREQPPYILTRLLSNAIRRWTQKHRVPCTIPALASLIGSCKTCPIGPKASREFKLFLKRKREGGSDQTCRPWEKAIDANDDVALEAALTIAKRLKERSEVERCADES